MYSVLKKLASSPVVHQLIIITLISIIYLPSISYPLKYDSDLYLQHSPFVREFPLFEMSHDIPAFYRTYTPIAGASDYIVNFVCRPFCYFTFHLNYLVGGFAPEGYRLVNILIHTLTSLLVYTLVKHLLSRKGTAMTNQCAAVISFCCATLFAVSPMGTEAVAYVVQRFTSLAACLYIAAIYGNLRAMDANTTSSRMAWQGVSLIALILGMLTKEMVFTAPIMILLLNILVLRKSFMHSLRSSLPQLCCLPIIPVLLVLCEQGDETPGVNLDDVINISNFGKIPPSHYLTVQIRAILSYFRMVLFPYGQSFQHTYPDYASFFDPSILIALALILLFLATAVRFACCRNDQTANLISFFIIWYFVTISISSSFIPLSEIFVERRVYLPSVGLIAGVVLHLNRIRQERFSHLMQIISGLLFVVWVTCFTSAAIKRVEVWSSKRTLWLDVVEKYPHNPVALNDLAYEYLKKNEYASAIPYLKRSLESGYDLKTAQNLGSAFINSGNYQDALRVYVKALSHSPDDYLLLAGAGTASYFTGNSSAALLYLEKAVATDSKGALALHYLNLVTGKLRPKK